MAETTGEKIEGLVRAVDQPNLKELTRKRLKASYEIIKILQDSGEIDGMVDIREINIILQAVQEYLTEIYSAQPPVEIKKRAISLFELATKNLEAV